jgi:hypothetical protein
MFYGANVLFECSVRSFCNTILVRYWNNWQQLVCRCLASSSDANEQLVGSLPGGIVYQRFTISATARLAGPISSISLPFRRQLKLSGDRYKTNLEFQVQ